MKSPNPRPATRPDRRAARRSTRSLVALAAFVCVCSPVWAHLPPLDTAPARADVPAPSLGGGAKTGAGEPEPGAHWKQLQRRPATRGAQSR